MASVRQIKVGMEIAISKFGPEHQLGGAEHDIIYLFPPGTRLTDEEKAVLEDADWHYNSEEGWYHYA